MDAVVVGGSMSGLLAASALASCGKASVLLRFPPRDIFRTRAGRPPAARRSRRFGSRKPIGYRGTNVMAQRTPGTRLSRASAVRSAQSNSSASATYEAS